MPGGSRVPHRRPRAALVELSGVPPCAAHPAPAPPLGAAESGSSVSVNVNWDYDIPSPSSHLRYQTGLTVPRRRAACRRTGRRRLDDVAETNAAGLVAAELD